LHDSIVMMRPAFRFAPSPNGRLHLGHAYSALLNHRMAREAGGRFLIRIEDIDTIRCTPALAQAALDDLAWLGLVSDEPVLFQSAHLSDYHSAQDRLRRMGLLYPCFCSRQQVLADAKEGKVDPEGQPLYSGKCRSKPANEVQELLKSGLPHSWRINADMLNSLEEWGDVILVRKDIGTSYHIAVTVDDARQGITHVVRGQDLYASTSIHRMLQKLLVFPEPIYHHHELIGDETGRKLSKSAGDRSLASLRQAHVKPEEIRATLGF
jgi:glutamyl-Q tRNA(Asp) synthetase